MTHNFQGVRYGRGDFFYPGGNMATKRMISVQLVDSDAFLNMPASTQNLYFHLNMRADDDGFVDSPRKIMKIVGASEDDMKLLLAKRYLLTFDSGIIVIKHWKLHNTIQKDRYKPTLYQEEMKQIAVKENGAYTDCIHVGSNMLHRLDQGRLDKVKLDKDNTDSVLDIDLGIEPQKARINGFKKPTLEELAEHLKEKGITKFTAEEFYDHYESNGWMVGKVHMKNWRAAVGTWTRNTINTKETWQDKEAAYKKQVLDKVLGRK
jgi:hypothetical protein